MSTASVRPRARSVRLADRLSVRDRAPSCGSVSPSRWACSRCSWALGTFFEVAYYPERMRTCRAVVLGSRRGSRSSAWRSAARRACTRGRSTIAVGVGVGELACICAYHAMVGAQAERVATILGCVLNLLSVLCPWGWAAQAATAVGAVASFARGVAVLRHHRRARLPRHGAALRRDDVGVGGVLPRPLPLRVVRARRAADRGGGDRRRARADRRDAEPPARPARRARPGERLTQRSARLRLEQPLPLRPAARRLLARARTSARRRRCRAELAAARVPAEQPGAAAGAAAGRAHRDRRRAAADVGAGRADAAPGGRVGALRAGRARRPDHRRPGRRATSRAGERSRAGSVGWRSGSPTSPRPRSRTAG